MMENNNILKDSVDICDSGGSSFDGCIKAKLPENGIMKLVPDGKFKALLFSNWSNYIADNALRDQTVKIVNNITAFGNGIYVCDRDRDTTFAIPSLPRNSVVINFDETDENVFGQAPLSNLTASEDTFSCKIAFDKCYMEYLQEFVAEYPDGWNLNDLPLPHAFRSQTIFESSNSFTPLTVQPFDLPKVSLLLPHSHSKLWIFIDPKDQFKVNDYLNFHREWQCSSALLHGKSLMDVETLTTLNVNFWTESQHPGEMMILGAGTCFQSMCHGPSVSEEAFFYENSFYTKSIQRKKCKCPAVNSTHCPPIFDEIRSLLNMVEYKNYDVFHGIRSDANENLEDEDATENENDQNDGNNNVASDADDQQPDDTLNPTTAPPQPTGRPRGQAKNGKGWTKRIPTLKGSRRSAIDSQPEPSSRQPSQQAPAADIDVTQQSSAAPSTNRTPAPSKDIVDKLGKRRRQSDRDLTRSPNSKKRKHNNDEGRSRNAKDPGSIFFQRENDKVEQRLRRVIRDIGIHNDLLSGSSRGKKTPKRNLEVLQAQQNRDLVIKEALLRDRDRYNILKQIYCNSKGTLRANLNLGMNCEAIIRLFFNNVSTINKKIWDLSVHNAIKDVQKRDFYKDLINDELEWNTFFNINHGIRIPWREWMNGFEDGSQSEDAAVGILQALEENDIAAEDESDSQPMDTEQIQTSQRPDIARDDEDIQNSHHSNFVDNADTSSETITVSESTQEKALLITDTSTFRFSSSFICDPANKSKKYGPAEIPPGAFSTLLPRKKLSSFVVDEYFELLDSRQTTLKCIAMKTFVGYPQAGRLSKKQFSKRFPCDLIMVPILVESHYVLFVADFNSKTFTVYNSLRSFKLKKHRRAIEDMENFVKKLAHRFLDGISLDDWESIISEGVPQQMPQSVDCGIFVCTFARRLASGKSLVDIDAVKIRKRMAFELINGKLEEEELETLRPKTSTPANSNGGISDIQTERSTQQLVAANATQVAVHNEGSRSIVDNSPFSFEVDQVTEIFDPTASSNFVNHIQSKYNFNPDRPNELASHQGSSNSIGPKKIELFLLRSLKETEKMYEKLMAIYFNLIVERNTNSNKYKCIIWNSKSSPNSYHGSGVNKKKAEEPGNRCIFDDCRFMFSLMGFREDSGDHFGLFVFDSELKCYFFYDPSTGDLSGKPVKQKSGFDQNITTLLHSVASTIVDSTGETFDWNGWKYELPWGLTCPSTSNNKDFNFYICLFAEQLSRGVLDIQVNYPKERRRQMVAELVAGKLFKPI